MKIGDYVRTKDGYMSKIKKLGINIYTDVGCWSEDYVIKSSPNIIDLIELNDLIRVEWGKEDNNIFEVVAIDKNNNEIGVFKNDFDIYFVGIEQIKSIVTKEQFENMEYRIGE